MLRHFGDRARAGADAASPCCDVCDPRCCCGAGAPRAGVPSRAVPRVAGRRAPASSTRRSSRSSRRRSRPSGARGRCEILRGGRSKVDRAALLRRPARLRHVRAPAPRRGARARRRAARDGTLRSTGGRFPKLRGGVSALARVVPHRRPRLRRGHEPAGDPRHASTAGRSRSSRSAPTTPDAPALGARASGRRADRRCSRSPTFADRAARDAAMADWLAERGVRLVVLAGYMQLLTPGFLARFPHAVVNVHPALLPAFPGTRRGRAGARARRARSSASRSTSSTRASTPGRSSSSAPSSCRTRAPPRRCSSSCTRSSTSCCRRRCALIARGAVRIDPADPGALLTVGRRGREPACRWRFAYPRVRMPEGTENAPTLPSTAPGEVRDPPRAAVGLRQDRHRRVRARARRARRRARLDGRHGRRARRRGHHRTARSPTSRASPRSWTGASRRCTRSSTPACSPSATTPSHLAAAADAEVEFVDLVCVNLYPFEQTVARRGVADAEVIENIDIGGPTMIRAAAKNFAFAAPVVSPGQLRRDPRRAARRRRQALAGHAREPRGRGVRLHGALRHGDRALVRREARRLPAAVRARVREGHRPLLRREPAPARRLLRAGRLADAPALERAPARRQAAVVQQPARPRRRAHARARVRRSRRA